MCGLLDIFHFLYIKGPEERVGGEKGRGKESERGKGKHTVEAWMTAHIRLMIRRALQKHPRNDTIKIGEPEIFSVAVHTATVPFISISMSWLHVKQVAVVICMYKVGGNREPFILILIVRALHKPYRLIYLTAFLPASHNPVRHVHMYAQALHLVYIFMGINPYFLKNYSSMTPASCIEKKWLPFKLSHKL